MQFNNGEDTLPGFKMQRKEMFSQALSQDSVIFECSPEPEGGGVTLEIASSSN